MVSVKIIKNEAICFSILWIFMLTHLSAGELIALTHINFNPDSGPVLFTQPPIKSQSKYLTQEIIISTTNTTARKEFTWANPNLRLQINSTEQKSQNQTTVTNIQRSRIHRVIHGKKYTKYYLKSIKENRILKSKQNIDIRGAIQSSSNSKHSEPEIDERATNDFFQDPVNFMKRNVIHTHKIDTLAGIGKTLKTGEEKFGLVRDDGLVQHSYGLYPNKEKGKTAIWINTKDDYEVDPLSEKKLILTSCLTGCTMRAAINSESKKLKVFHQFGGTKLSEADESFYKKGDSLTYDGDYKPSQTALHLADSNAKAFPETTVVLKNDEGDWKFVFQQQIRAHRRKADGSMTENFDIHPYGVEEKTLDNVVSQMVEAGICGNNGNIKSQGATHADQVNLRKRYFDHVNNHIGL